MALKLLFVSIDLIKSEGYYMPKAEEQKGYSTLVK